MTVETSAMGLVISSFLLHFEQDIIEQLQLSEFLNFLPRIGVLERELKKLQIFSFGLRFGVDVSLFFLLSDTERTLKKLVKTMATVHSAKFTSPLKSTYNYRLKLRRLL